MIRPTHPCPETAATIRGNPFSRSHTTMIRPLSCICVLVGAALTVAAASDPPAPGPQNEPVNSRAQEPSPRAKQDRTHEESNETIEKSNETIPQPGRIQYSYPLKADDERHRRVA